MWSVSLLVAMGFIAYFCKIGAQFYVAMDIRTETRTQYSQEMSLPSVTICFRVDTRMNCYKKINVIDGSKCTTNWTAPHLHLYSNGEVSKIEPSSKDAECFTANEDGSLLQRGTVNNMTIIIRDPLNRSAEELSLFLIVRDPSTSRALRLSLLSQDLIHGHSIIPRGTYEVKVSRTDTERKSAPYPSNCSNGEGIENIFSTQYTQASCLENCIFHSVYDECGAVIDYWKKYLPLGAKTNNKTDEVGKPHRFI